tara:strand:+ start:82 stop:288 length:207 start_codon:yes stop_codon:yes gene_type:complete
MATRKPKAVYERARQLYAEGKDIIGICFLTDLTEEQVRRAVDPAYAAAQKKKFARRTVLRRRGVTNPY